LEGRDAVLVDGEGHDTMLVAFGGIRGEIAIPPFEFFSVVGDIPVTKVFVRDLDQAWYQRGVRGLGTSVAETAVALEHLVRERRARRVVMTGNSAGGFAAILFGRMLGVDGVVAFAPQTFIDRWNRLRHRDHRWKAEIRALRHRPPSAPVLDLRRAVRAAVVPVEIHYDRSFRLDALHAERLDGQPGVQLHPYRGGSHNLVRTLRDTGDLKQILTYALAVTP
jgi:dienelactone hydrolase